jgi:hypothetical protein
MMKIYTLSIQNLWHFFNKKNGLRYRRAVLRKDSIESSMTLIRGFLFIKTGGRA